MSSFPICPLCMNYIDSNAWHCKPVDCWSSGTVQFLLHDSKLCVLGLKGQSNKRLISMNEVKQHQNEGSMWTVLKGRVYNLSPYMKFHPGGMIIILCWYFFSAIEWIKKNGVQ